MYLMTDNRRLDITDYDPHLVAASLIDREKLPELVPMDTIVGTLLPEVAEELGLSPSTRVVTALNDTQAGGVGAGAFAGTHAAVSVGSTSVMITHVDFKRTDVFNSIVSMPSPVPDTYFVMAENGMAGAALERFLTNIVYGSDHFSDAAVHDRYEALQRVAGEIPAGSDGLMFLPWLSGSMAPSEDGQMRGGFLNISTRTTRGDMARAVLEGVSQNLRWVRGPVEKFAKRTFSHYSIYGGGARSDLWCQIMADVLGTPVHQLDNCDYTVSVGSGLLAFERLGDLGFDDISGLVRTRREFDPDPRNTATYDALHEQFVKAFKATKPIYRALNATPGGGRLMDHDEVAAVLDVGIAAVRDAGSIALEYFRTDMAVDNKLAGIAYDPVTEADKRVEAHVRAAINERFPDHQVIGEESGTTGSGPISWIIDPIDGTRAFISGMPTWGTLLGLVVDGQPVAGVMHQPFTDETFAADPARGSRFLRAGTERRLRDPRERHPRGRGHVQHPSEHAGVGRGPRPVPRPQRPGAAAAVGRGLLRLRPRGDGHHRPGGRRLPDALRHRPAHPDHRAGRRCRHRHRGPRADARRHGDRRRQPRPARAGPRGPARLTSHPTGRPGEERRWTSKRSTAPCTPTPSATG